MLEFAPYLQEQLLIWDKHVDASGKTTLNMVEYMEYRKACAEKSKLAAKKKEADKANKKKIWSFIF